MSDKTLFTAWADVGGGAGKDRVVAVLVQRANSEAQMRETFLARHGLEPQHVVPGLTENVYTEFALSKHVMKEARLANLLLPTPVSIEIEVKVSVKRA